MLGKTILKINQSLEGETIEMKMRRVMKNNEPISDGAPLIFTDRKDGILPAYDIRTDRMDVAIDAMSKVAESRRMQRAAYLEKRDAKPEIPSNPPPPEIPSNPT